MVNLMIYCSHIAEALVIMKEKMMGYSQMKHICLQ